MNDVEQVSKWEMKEWLPFESLLAELFARFVNVRADEVDGAIEDAQRVICERFGLDRSSLFQNLEDGASTLLLTHVFQRLGLPWPVEKRIDPATRAQYYWQPARAEPSADDSRIDARSMFPWFYEQLRRGQTVVVPDVQALGADAAKDREFLNSYGTKSTVTVPLFQGGTWLGILAFGSVRERRDWPEGLVKRFQFLADVFTNALARKRADEAQHHSEARFRHIADTAPVLIWMAGPDKRCTFFNKTWLDFTGRAAAQEMGDGWTAGVHPDDLADCNRSYAAAFDARRPFTLHYRLRRHDGEYRWITDHGVPCQDAGGAFTGYLGSCVDFTEHKIARQDLQKAAAEWQTTFDSIPHPVMLLDREFKILRANAAAAALASNAGGVVGQRCSALLRGSCDHANCPLQTALQTNHYAEAEIYDEKERRWVRETVNPIFDETRQVTGVVFAVEDITKRKLSEEKLLKSLAEIETLKDRLQAEADYLKAEIKATAPVDTITGGSEAIRQALHQVRQVAPTNSTVLICGETGVGKELFAEAIHNLSPRRDRVIVKVNCAALPPPLVESELFGREKGAYTGALTRQGGRFEIADHSTIFLDEVGELSLEVQAKLLRVLQEGKFERLGSPRTIQVNLRLIAATHRDLAEEVRKGRFRQDLFYRINVFPIQVPPLRERQEDIPVLVWTFLEELSVRMGRKITKIPRKTMETLQRYSWPGNVRELRNFIERSVIITSGETLRIPQLADLQAFNPPVTLAESEREHILKVLETTLWHIKGPRGAALKLGLKPSTLYTRMQKLGIPNRRQRDDLRT
jgi:PAS domain S-box-containing protein